MQGVGGRLQVKETIMKCVHCHAAMKRGTAPFEVDRHGYHLRFDAVPAWVCAQCGEPYFEEREVDRIQRAIKALDRQAGKILVPA
jgi:YgiT-type zinc finger domain-containing protein